MKVPPLYVLRHGQTEWNAEFRIQGTLDSPLTATGRVQAQQQNAILTAQDLTGFEAICSPQGRAQQTADLALAGLGLTLRTDPRLAEIAVGDWEGLRRQDLPLDLALDESEENALALYDLAPGGEGFTALHARCTDFLRDVNRPAVLVTHGVTSRMLRLVALGHDIAQIGDLPGGQGVVYAVAEGRQDRLSIGA